MLRLRSGYLYVLALAVAVGMLLSRKGELKRDFLWERARRDDPVAIARLVDQGAADGAALQGLFQGFGYFAPSSFAAAWKRCGPAGRALIVEAFVASYRTEADPLMRLHVVGGLHEVAGERTPSLLATALSDPAEEVRNMALLRLCRRASIRELDPLLRALEDPSLSKREVVEALALIPGKSAEDVVGILDALALRKCDARYWPAEEVFRMVRAHTEGIRSVSLDALLAEWERRRPFLRVDARGRITWSGEPGEARE